MTNYFYKAAEMMRRLTYYLRRDKFDRELREEMDFHLSMKMNEADRSHPEAARPAHRSVVRKFGNQTLLLEASREMWGFGSVETVIQDLRYSFRLIKSKPGFAAVAIATLGCGIGLNSAIFSVINSYLLRPLPYKAPDRLVQIWESDKRPAGEHQNVVSPANFADWRKQASSFESMSAYNTYLASLAQPDGAVEVAGALVTPNFLDTLGVSPVIGRTFAPDEDQPGKNHVVIISNNFWRTRMGASTDVIGQSLTLGGVPCAIIGVLPADYRHPEPLFDEGADVFRTLLIKEGADRGSHYLRAIGRITQGVSVEQARAEISSIADALEQSYPDTNSNDQVALVPLQKQYTGDLRLPLLILQGAVLMVLLIACVNMANLLLARITVREREIAVRSALGASRARLGRLFFTESVLLSFLGGAAGLGAAYTCVAALTSFAPRYFERLGPVRLDWRVIAFTMLVSVGTVLFFGLAPALKAARTDINRALKQGMTMSRGFGIRSSLVASEIGLALVLLAGAGLMLRSLVQLERVPLGFNPDNVVTMQVDLPAGRAKTDRVVLDSYHQIMDAVRSLPGVRSAAVTSSVPLSGLNNTTGNFTVEGQPPLGAGQQQQAGFRILSPDYFSTMGIPVMKGRDFNNADNSDSTPVVIINSALARRYFGDTDPIAQRLHLSMDAKGKYRVIVGVVRDFKYDGLELPVGPETYVPHSQNAWDFMALAVRTDAKPRNSIVPIQNAIWGIDRNIALSRTKTMPQAVAVASEWTRFYLMLLCIFAVVALALSAIGIYGVMSYTVSQSTREIGIRMALGARTSDALGLMIRRAAALTAAGIGGGLIVALAVTRVMKALLFEVAATDPLTFIIVPFVLAAAALLACYLPARRAARVDPVLALRSE